MYLNKIKWKSFLSSFVTSFETTHTLRETIVLGNISNMNISTHNVYNTYEGRGYTFQLVVI